MVRYVYFLLIVGIAPAWVIPGISATNAVQPPAAASLLPSAPTHLQTTWASLKGGPVDLPTMLTALDSPLAVTDDHGGAYTITRFRFSYRQKVQFQDDSTGEVKTNYTLVSREFRQTNRLDSLWSNDVRSTLQAGDSFTIDNIIVKDESGKKLLAPELAFDIK
jgi:hypothetical protein